MSKQTIAIDFDGVLHKYSKGYFDGSIYDEPVEGSLEAIFELSKTYKIVVFTAREEFKPVSVWLIKHGFKPFISDLTNIKPKAVIYIDDRALHFTDWKSALEETRERLK
jgi:ribonucleotide monophosphatase NagD (HAD superfamily)